MRDRMMQFSDETGARLALTEIASIKREAGDMAELVCRETERGIDGLNGSIRAILHTVKTFISSLEESRSETESRFALVCGMLSGLERNKQEMDRQLTEYFRLNESYITVKMRFTHWKGCLSVRSVDSAETQQTVREAAELLQSFRQQTETSETRYLQYRERLECFAHGVFPRFLEEVYGLSDAEHNGNGLRAAALINLCGELCHEAERVFL